MGLPIAPRAACAGVDPGGTCGTQCNGVDTAKCNYPGKSSPCSGSSCKDGLETHQSLCDGAGRCSDVPNACGAYVCGATACKSTCAADGDCAAGFRCNAGVCIAKVGLGTDCTQASECETGFCADGVCCGQASCAGGSSCANPGKKGACTKSRGTACAADAECGSGTCVDSVCCESRCEGQCQACDVAGSTGSCLPVLGDPHGARARCDDGGGEICKAKACDGKDASACLAYAKGPSSACKPAACAQDKLAPESHCDGAGACREPEAVACAPYACQGTSCASACTSFRDCAAGHTCAGGKCVPGSSCTDDRLSSIGRDGTEISCGAYLCTATGECGSACDDSRDCAGGYVCDLAARQCLVPTSVAGDGGCTAGRGGGSAAIAWAIIGLGFARRRRERAR